MSFLSPGSSFLSYQVSSGLLSSTNIKASSKATSNQTIRVDCSEQGEPRSNTDLQEGKAKGPEGSSSQPTQAEQSAQEPIPL